METNISASVLLSIFKRKGGESIWTKIVNQNNSNHFELSSSDLIDFKENEKALIYAFKNPEDWFILTTSRIIINENQTILSIWYKLIDQVQAPLFREQQLGAKNKSEFTQIELKYNHSKKYYLSVEAGLPYAGIFHLLQFVCRKNKT